MMVNLSFLQWVGGEVKEATVGPSVMGIVTVFTQVAVVIVSVTLYVTGVVPVLGYEKMGFCMVDVLLAGSPKFQSQERTGVAGSTIDASVNCIWNGSGQTD